LTGPSDLQLTGVLMPGAATVELLQQIEAAGPFGAGAPGPRYAFADMAIRFAKRVGENHLKLSFGEGTGPTMDAIAFGAMDSPLGAALVNAGGGRFHLAGRLDLNTWRGRQSVQLRLEDAAPA
ncbi:MAG: single-stranded-DNA-specific exonuclease RecJ, partial [Pseudomonadota bacterium]